MNEEIRPHMIGLRLSTKELERLDELAAHYGLSRVNALRMFVKRAHDVYGGAKRKGRSRMARSVMKNAPKPAVRRKGAA